MRAIVLPQFGPPEVLVAVDVPDPVPGPGQALVRVAYANITFVETMFRASGFGPFAAELPVVPGNGVGGVVADVGPGVDEALVGRRVVSSLDGSGGYAELAVVAVDRMVEVPDDVPLDVAVALLADGRTALALLDAAQVRAGDRVLVEAAAGGVGTLLVQLAKAAGATVVGAVGSEAKADVARDVGADAVVDYSVDGWPASAGSFDVVFDGVGGDVGRTAFGLLAPGGRFVRYGAASGTFADVSGDGIVDLPRITPEQSRDLSAAALRAAAEGRLRPVIGQRFPLEGAADAHASIEARQSIGKTLLVVADG